MRSSGWIPQRYDSSKSVVSGNMMRAEFLDVSTFQLENMSACENGNCSAGALIVFLVSRSMTSELDDRAHKSRR